MVTLYSGTGKRIDIDTVAQNRDFTPWADVLHRGWHEGVPDNTLPAYYLIAQNGYHWGECDLFACADGTPILSHNATITGTINGVSTTLTVAESTEAEIKQLVLATHPAYGEIHPASLADLLELAKTINVGIVLDMKVGSYFNNTAKAEAVARTVIASGWADHVIYMPTTVNDAKAIQAIDRNASFDFVSSVKTADKLPTDFSGMTSLLTGSNTVGYDFQGGVSDECIEIVHNAGLSVSFWGISNTAHFRHNPLRVTYSSYQYAHLGRDYIRQKQDELAAQYPIG